MKLTRSIELMAEYSNCKDCGSQFIGNGEGTLEINDGIFKRTCKCGWNIEVREDTTNDT